MVKVLVTGASGFVATHLVQLLDKKGYDIVGTVRSKEKGVKLKGKFPNFNYEIVGDMTVEGAFDEVLKKYEFEFLFHTASPFFYDTTEPEKDLIIPAIKGTENILSSVEKYGKSIKKVVLTSSDAAVYSAEDEQNNKLSFDESSWNNISYEDACKDSVYAYYGAKSFAEKYAWEFLKTHDVKFQMTAVNPVYIFGPQVFEEDAKGKLNTSNQLIGDLLNLTPEEMEKFDNLKGGYVDVRDIAKAHLLAIENEECAGKRLFCYGGKFSNQMLLDIVNKNFPQLKLPLGTPGSGPEDIKELCQTSNEATKKLLGFEFNDIENIVVDVVEQILKSKL